MHAVYFIANGEMFCSDGSGSKPIFSAAVDRYIRNSKEIARRKDWKTQGTGARFLGTYQPGSEEMEVRAGVESLGLTDDGKIIYAVNFEDSCGLYMKDPGDEKDAPETLLTRRSDTQLFSFDAQANGSRIIASISDGREKHLALYREEDPALRLITEGESVDISPIFDRNDPDVVYYSSAGIFVNANHAVHYSHYVLNRFDTSTGQIDELLADEKYDYIYPRQDSEGRLYCIKRPRAKERGVGSIFLDVLLLPVRLLKALFFWLNFFSQRYSGESLSKTVKGPNPAKNQQAKEEDIFIEGNLIQVEKTLKENSTKNEKHPGIAPQSWELVRIDGSVEVSIQKGVLDYAFAKDGTLFYSNGRYILKKSEANVEPVHKVNVAKCIVPM